jgi:hypothetical protein
MKFKEDVEGLPQARALLPEGDWMDGAEDAFKDSRYVEAFTLLHAYIDWWMTDLIQLREGAKTLSKAYWLLFERKYRFRSSAKILLNEAIIDHKQYERLLEFNELRDKIIHRLVMYSYQCHERNKVTITEVIEGFEKGKALAHLLREKTGSVGCCTD